MRVKSHCSTNLIQVKTNKAGDSGLLEASLLLVPVLKEVLVHLTSNSPFCLVLNLKNKQQMICGSDLQSSLGKLGVQVLCLEVALVLTQFFNRGMGFQ